jgi:hypothetical protein
MPEVVAPSKVSRLIDAMLAFPQVPLETRHFFADGMYCRWVARPKGTVIVGKKHLKEHFYIVLKGSIAVAVDAEIAGAIPYEAPAVIVCEPGSQKVVWALEDTICLTVHRLDHGEERDLEAIETQLVEPDERSLFGPGNTLKVLP